MSENVFKCICTRPIKATLYSVFKVGQNCSHFTMLYFAAYA